MRSRPFWLYIVVALAVSGTLTVVGLRLVLMPSDEPSAEYYGYHASARASDGPLPVLWRVPSFSFPNQHGEPTTDADLRGHVWIADFIFTQCTSACPLMTARMVLLQRRLGNPTLRFVSFSVDPAHDTPDVLRKYAVGWRPDEPRWYLLSTTPEGLKDLTAGMHVTAERTDDPKDPITHTSMFLLVDARGVVRGVYDSDDPAATDRLDRDARTLAGLGHVQSPGHDEASGAELYAALGCGACHTRPDVAPRLDGILGRKVKLEDGVEITADAAYVRESIVAPGAKIVDGYLRLMPSYADQLTQGQIDALVAYVDAMPPAASTPAATSPIGAPAARPPAAAAAVDTDPVCSMPVRVVHTTPKAVYEGHVYHFCSERCLGRFLAEPGRFVAHARR